MGGMGVVGSGFGLWDVGWRVGGGGVALFVVSGGSLVLSIFGRMLRIIGRVGLWMLSR